MLNMHQMEVQKAFVPKNEFTYKIHKIQKDSGFDINKCYDYCTLLDDNILNALNPVWYLQ
jgi:hypothetical protein